MQSVCDLLRQYKAILRCLPQYAQMWRKFAIWCGNTELQMKFEQENAAYAAFWCAKYASGKMQTAVQFLNERERQAEKLRQILTLGHWED